MKKHIFSVAGYVVGTFITQALSHFMVFAKHYAAVSYIKAEPVFLLGIAAMLVQGVILSYAFASSRFYGQSLIRAICFTWLFGAVLVSYESLAEASKYAVPNIPSWIAVEAGVGLVQFTLIGLFLGLAHRGQDNAQQPTKSLT